LDKPAHKIDINGSLHDYLNTSKGLMDVHRSCSI
jgi:hypothetical protein